ncbi:MAG: Rrf2 family transcriptional regulator [Deferribacterales bacterium]
MQATAQTLYAIYALTYIAKAKSPIKAQEISEKTGLPKRFLEITLLKLKAANILESKKGRDGGFFLKRTVQEITLYDIVSVTENSINIFDCTKHLKENCNFKSIFDTINNKLTETLKSITLEDIIKSNNINITDFVI